jgi:hypothetical protein
MLISIFTVIPPKASPMENSVQTEKPSTVVRAVKLLWASLLLGPLKIALEFSYVQASGALAFVVVGLFVTFPVVAFFISKISAGRNWARITFLVMFILVFVSRLSLVVEEFDRSAVLVGILSIAQFALQLYVLFLIFTQPGSSWFRKV